MAKQEKIIKEMAVNGSADLLFHSEESACHFSGSTEEYGSTNGKVFAFNHYKRNDGFGLIVERLL